MEQYIGHIATIASILTIISFTINIIQYKTRKQELAALRTHVQENYNAYFSVARACTRARSENKDVTDTHMIRELEYIRGVCDSQRNGIIAYSREHLSFLPFYEHPMYPGKEQPKEIMLGMPPEQYNSNNDEQT